MSAGDALKELRALDHETRLLEHVSATVSWDQETYMPSAAAEERAEQLSLLQGLVHQRTSDPRIRELLATWVVDPDAEWAGEEGLTAAGAELREVNQAFVREKQRQYRHATLLPDRLVREMAETASRGQNEWIAARRDNDFPRFRRWLQKLVELNRETADCLGYRETPYDALLDQYEPGATTAEVTAVFRSLRDELVPLVQAITAAPPPDTAVIRQPFAVERQQLFNEQIMVALGYDLQRGRMDRSAHPFTTTLGSDDVRITTRYDEHLVTSALFSTIHETGHALYELGVGETLRGTLLAEGTSLGIHESQSRLWENMIGRSLPFWQYWLPRLTEYFPDELHGVTADQFYRAVNCVEPSLIRVEADEVTYSLHIILRFELEQALIGGTLAVDDLPDAWRETSRNLLGVEPRSDAEGVLQDVHWSMGAFGYFPTYALGNLYAAQFLEVMERDIPGMWEETARGNTQPVLDWLRQNVHRHGRGRRAAELVQDITGGPLHHAPFVDYLRRKYHRLYGLQEAAGR